MERNTAKQQIMENTGLWPESNAITPLYNSRYKQRIQREKLKVLTSESLAGGGGGGGQKETYPKKPVGKTDRKSGAGQARLESPAKTAN